MVKRRDYILYLEDDEVDAIKFSATLQRLHPEEGVVVRKSGKAGLAYLEAHNDHPPRIIILDLNLPEMNGFEFLRQIKQIAHLRAIPVIVFTASDDKEDVQQSFTSQAAGYMVKPLSEDDFIRVVTLIQQYWDMSATGR